MENNSNMDGNLVKLDYLPGNASIMHNYKDESSDFFYGADADQDEFYNAEDDNVDDFYSADGSGDDYYNIMADDNDFFQADGDQDEFFSAVGKKKSKKRRSNGFGSGTFLDPNERARRRDLREKNKDKRFAMKQQKTDSKAQERIAQSDAQKKIAESMMDQSGDKALADALAKTSTPAEPVKAGMSRGVKIGLIVGAVVVAGLIGFMIYKKMKANKK